MKCRRFSCLIVFSFFSLLSFSQFDQSFALSAMGHFHFKTRGLATNDAGVGLRVEGALFANHKLQLVVEAATERFFGDKLLVVDAEGNKAKGATIHSLRVGPRLFLSKRISFSTTYGPGWHIIRAFEYTTDYGFRFALTGLAGYRRKLVVSASFVHMPAEAVNIQYASVGLGYRF